MKEIRFKAIEVNNKKYEERNGSFVYGYLVGKNHIGDRYICFEIDPETIGQFTGIYDTEGKEIYESDIVIKNNNYEEEYVVDYMQGMFVIKPYKFDYDCDIKMMSSYALNFFIENKNILKDNKCDKIKVIGNIHESRK